MNKKQSMNKSKKKKERKNKKKKPNLFYQSVFFISLFLFIVISYLIALLSVKEQYFPYLTKQIEKLIEENIQSDVNIDKIGFKITSYNRVRISITKLDITMENEDHFIIPKTNIDIAFFNLISGRVRPKKLEIIGSNFTIYQNEEQNPSPDTSANDVVNNKNLKIAKLFKNISNNKILFRNIELKDTQLTIVNNEKITHLVIKESKISAKFDNDKIFIKTDNIANFNNKVDDLKFQSNCTIISNAGDLNCYTKIQDFKAYTVSDMHEQLGVLQNINANLNATLSIIIKNFKIDNIQFRISSRNGEFSYPKFFDQNLQYKSLNARGAYYKKIDQLSIDEIDVEFLSSQSIGQEEILNPHLNMSLKITNFSDKPSSKSSFNISLQDIPGSKLSKYWPTPTAKKSRNWVTNHISKGKIKNSYLNFSLNKGVLEEMNAQFVVEKMRLKYHDKFPEINNMSAVIDLQKDSMIVSVKNGTILNSEISNADIKIQGFNKEDSKIEIELKTHGLAGDNLKHVNFKSEKFSKNVDKYLNGQAQSSITLRLPFRQPVTINNSYIKIISKVQNLNDPYITGDVVINSEKKANSDDFAINIDLTNSDVNMRTLGLKKQKDIQSNLKFNLLTNNPGKLAINNIKISKPKTKNTVIIGDIELDTDPLKFTKIDLKNRNFNYNDYDLTYTKPSDKISIKAEQLNIEDIIKSGFEDFTHTSQDKALDASETQIISNKLLLADDGVINNFYLYLKNQKGIYQQGKMVGNYNEKDFVKFDVQKKDGENFSTITGYISNLSYIAQSFGISDLLSNGDANIKIKNYLKDGHVIYEGKLTIKKEFTVYENESVKRLANDDLFSKIRDLIFSEKKTTFTSAEVEFIIMDGVLEIKSLIANNLKIGITAKGFIDLRNGQTNIKGMIIPGYVINNLFGMGDLPVIGYVSDLLTGGKDGGIFGIRYEYSKNKKTGESSFKTNKVSAFIPTTFKNLFDLI